LQEDIQDVNTKEIKRKNNRRKIKWNW
jgi:hypothetical protein